MRRNGGGPGEAGQLPLGHSGGLVGGAEGFSGPTEDHGDLAVLTEVGRAGVEEELAGLRGGGGGGEGAVSPAAALSASWRLLSALLALLSTLLLPPAGPSKAGPIRPGTGCSRTSRRAGGQGDEGGAQEDDEGEVNAQVEEVGVAKEEDEEGKDQEGGGQGKAVVQAHWRSDDGPHAAQARLVIKEPGGTESRTKRTCMLVEEEEGKTTASRIAREYVTLGDPIAFTSPGAMFAHYHGRVPLCIVTRALESVEAYRETKWPSVCVQPVLLVPMADQLPGRSHRLCGSQAQ